MSDAPLAQNQSSALGGQDRSAQRISRLNGLEQLLGTIGRHLHATGDRHSDVVVQLQDRLRYLGHAAGTTTASPEIDRHLALFEAQLTSLAIRTGVQPQSLPQTPQQPTPQPMPQQQMSGVPVAPRHHTTPSIPPMTPPQPRQQMAPSAPAWGQLPQPTPTAEELVQAAARTEPVGAPPPTNPVRDLPGLDALTRQSNLTFEDAVAEDHARQAEEAGDALGAREEAHIFAYHPPIEKPAQSSSALPEAQDNALAETEPAQASSAIIEAPEDAEIAASDATMATTPPVAETEPVHQHTADMTSALHETELNETAPADLPVPNLDGDPSIGALRSDLDAAMTQPTAFDSKPVTYNSAPQTDPNDSAVPTARDVDVYEEIARLSERIDSVTTSVDRIESNVEQSRNELPSLIEQAAMAAAKQTAEQVKGNEAGLNRRIDDLHGMLNHRTPEPAPGVAIEARTAATYEQELTAEVRAVAADPTTENRLAQAKQTMLKKLAPMGNVIARRTRKPEAPVEATTNEYEAASSTVPLDQPIQQSPSPLDHVPQPLEPQEDLSEQSISSLRKSLFQNLKDGAPPALVVVFAAVAILSGSLLLTLNSNDSEQQQQTTAALQNLQTTKTSSSPAQVEVTHSTSRMSDAEVNKVRTVGALQQTASRETTANGITSAVKPTALRPLSNSPPGRPAGAGGSKLELPPLATGPLSLRVAAADGDAAAQFEVASRLAQGNGVARDPLAAVKWYTRAASAGHARAQYRLAALYERGAGVATDTGRAKIWYTRAAQQGNVKAMHNLAVLHAGQAAGAANYVSAAQWFERAAQHGLADSQFNVAILYLNGLGVTKNLPDAYKWFALAAKQGDQEAVRRLKGVTTQLTAAQRRTAEQTVKSWRARPALEAANKAVAWRPKPVTRTPAPIAATRTITPEPKVASNTGPLGPTDVKKVQRLLNGLGFDVGTPDGKVGGKTKTSIKSFQSQNGMIPTGTVDRALIGRIESIMRDRAAKLGKI